MAHQMYSVTRTLDELTTFAASRQNPVQNPLSRGLDPLQRLDFLDISIIGTLTEPGTATTIKFTDAANRDTLLDAIFSNIRFYSSTVGDVIRNLSFSELHFLVNMVNSDFLQTNLPVPGVNKAFGSGSEFRINLSIPFRLDSPAIQASYAPRAAQFSDGGLSTTNGTGTFTDANSVAWTVDSATRMEWRLRGPIVNVETKVSPVCYESYQNVGLAEFPAGLYFTLANHTDSANTAYGTSGGASAGCRVDLDGVTIINMNDFAPIDRVGAMISEGPDPSAWDMDVFLVDNDTIGSEAAYYIWDRAGIPIFFLSYNDLSFNWPVVEKRLVIEPGNNWSSTITYLATRVKRLSEIADAPRCGASINGPGVTVPVPYGPTSAAVVPTLPKTS